MVRIDVCLANGLDRSYPIYVGAGLLKSVGPRLHEREPDCDAFIVTDSNVGPLYLDAALTAIRAVGLRVDSATIAAGEPSKTVATWESLLGAVSRFEQAKPIMIVGLGGGVVGDIAGFVAASHRRGVPYAQVPTSLLGQTDCGVGGKVGVNHAGIKNLVGAFYQPKLVLMDVSTLATLPEREFRAGLAEVVKYGVICDPDLFAFLETNVDDILGRCLPQMAHIVTRCCNIKAEIVSQDERDANGARAVLNLGHTFGHAIEAASDFGLPHGEAVAIGMACACDVAKRLGMLADVVAERIEGLIRLLGLPSNYPAGLDLAHAMAAMRHDKKCLNGVNRFLLPRRIGEVDLIEDLDPALVADVLEDRQDRAESRGLD